MNHPADFALLLTKTPLFPLPYIQIDMKKSPIQCSFFAGISGHAL